MTHKSLFVRSLAIAAALLASSVSHATLVIYTNQASFLSAVTTPGIDTFTGFSISGTTTSPINRTAGSYTYTASSSSSSSTSSFFGAGTVANPWLSTNGAFDTILFNNFGAGVSAIGGLFFGSDILGNFLAGKSISITADDNNSSPVTQLITNSTTGSFLGFISDGLITSLSVTAVQTEGQAFVWPTVDNLTLAGRGSVPEQGTVPEPGTLVLAATAFGLMGAAARRRKAKQTT